MPSDTSSTNGTASSAGLAGSSSGYAIQTRAERLQILSRADALRDGTSDRLEVGYGPPPVGLSSTDAVKGVEESTLGSYELKAKSQITQARRIETNVTGIHALHAHSDVTLLAGTMLDQQTGAILVAAGMSDDMMLGGGVRVTAGADLWLAGLIGMEEKIGTAIADIALIELGSTSFDREYGAALHGYLVARLSGAVHMTMATGFRALSKVTLGVRNLMPMGGEASGGAAPAAPPAAPVAPPPVDSGADLTLAATDSARGISSTVTLDNIEDASALRVAVDIDNMEGVEDASRVLSDLTTVADTGDLEDGAAASRLQVTAGITSADDGNFAAVVMATGDFTEGSKFDDVAGGMNDWQVRYMDDDPLSMFGGDMLTADDFSRLAQDDGNFASVVLANGDLSEAAKFDDVAAGPNSWQIRYMDDDPMSMFGGDMLTADDFARINGTDVVRPPDELDLPPLQDWAPVDDASRRAQLGIPDDWSYQDAFDSFRDRTVGQDFRKDMAPGYDVRQQTLNYLNNVASSQLDALIGDPDSAMALRLQELGVDVSDVVAGDAYKKLTEIEAALRAAGDANDADFVKGITTNIDAQAYVAIQKASDVSETMRSMYLNSAPPPNVDAAAMRQSFQTQLEAAEASMAEAAMALAEASSIDDGGFSFSQAQANYAYYSQLTSFLRQATDAMDAGLDPSMAVREMMRMADADTGARSVPESLGLARAQEQMLDLMYADAFKIDPDQPFGFHYPRDAMTAPTDATNWRALNPGWTMPTEVDGMRSIVSGPDVPDDIYRAFNDAVGRSDDLAKRSLESVPEEWIQAAGLSSERAAALAAGDSSYEFLDYLKTLWQQAGDAGDTDAAAKAKYVGGLLDQIDDTSFVDMSYVARRLQEAQDIAGDGTSTPVRTLSLPSEGLEDTIRLEPPDIDPPDLDDVPPAVEDAVFYNDTEDFAVVRRQLDVAPADVEPDYAVPSVRSKKTQDPDNPYDLAQARMDGYSVVQDPDGEHFYFELENPADVPPDKEHLYFELENPYSQTTRPGDATDPDGVGIGGENPLYADQEESGKFVIEEFDDFPEAEDDFYLSREGLVSNPNDMSPTPPAPDDLIDPNDLDDLDDLEEATGIYAQNPNSGFSTGAPAGADGLDQPYLGRTGPRSDPNDLSFIVDQWKADVATVLTDAAQSGDVDPDVANQLADWLSGGRMDPFLDSTDPSLGVAVDVDTNQAMDFETWAVGQGVVEPPAPVAPRPGVTDVESASDIVTVDALADVGNHVEDLVSPADDLPTKLDDLVTPDESEDLKRIFTPIGETEQKPPPPPVAPKPQRKKPKPPVPQKPAHLRKKPPVPPKPSKIKFDDTKTFISSISGSTLDVANPPPDLPTGLEVRAGLSETPPPAGLEAVDQIIGLDTEDYWVINGLEEAATEFDEAEDADAYARRVENLSQPYSPDRKTPNADAEAGQSILKANNPQKPAQKQRKKLMFSDAVEVREMDWMPNHRSNFPDDKTPSMDRERRFFGDNWDYSRSYFADDPNPTFEGRGVDHPDRRMGRHYTPTPGSEWDAENVRHSSTGRKHKKRVQIMSIDDGHFPQSYNRDGQRINTSVQFKVDDDMHSQVVPKVMYYDYEGIEETGMVRWWVEQQSDVVAKRSGDSDGGYFVRKTDRGDVLDWHKGGNAGNDVVIDPNARSKPGKERFNPKGLGRGISGVTNDTSSAGTLLRQEVLMDSSMWNVLGDIDGLAKVKRKAGKKIKVNKFGKEVGFLQSGNAFYLIPHKKILSRLKDGKAFSEFDPTEIKTVDKVLDAANKFAQTTDLATGARVGDSGHFEGAVRLPVIDVSMVDELTDATGNLGIGAVRTEQVPTAPFDDVLQQMMSLHAGRP